MPPPPWSRTHSVSRLPTVGPSGRVGGRAPERPPQRGEQHQEDQEDRRLRMASDDGRPLPALLLLERPPLAPGRLGQGVGVAGGARDRVRGGVESIEGRPTASSTGGSSWSKMMLPDTVLRETSLLVVDGAFSWRHQASASGGSVACHQFPMPGRTGGSHPGGSDKPPGQQPFGRTVGGAGEPGARAGRHGWSRRGGPHRARVRAPPDARMTGARREGRGPAHARLIGAIRSSSFLRPTEVKMTSASASSPAPPVDDDPPLAPLPVDHHVADLEPEQLGPGRRPAPGVRRPLASNAPSAGETPLPKTERPGVPDALLGARTTPEVADGAAGPGARAGRPPAPLDGHVGDQLGRDLVEEPARDVGAGVAPQHPAPGVGHVEVALGPGDAHVAEAALLLELDRVARASAGGGRSRPPCRPGTPPGTRAPWRCAWSSATPWCRRRRARRSRPPARRPRGTRPGCGTRRPRPTSSSTFSTRPRASMVPSDSSSLR